ncbi:MAG: hypothetical protein KC505_05420 [Myxococcales bacterium]|nr:hypothetical protein [Myxococcales bacterium]USN51494.1 MAG: hypothetical protein H6731_03555 [Myxococcales bacterium]
MTILHTITELKQGAFFQSPFSLAALKINGPDAKDFLQRMSSANLSKLTQKTSQTTCFLNKYGRLIDRVLVIINEDEDDSYFLVSSFYEPKKLLDWLEQFHFIEDFSLSIHHQKAYVVVAHSNTISAAKLWCSQSKLHLTFFVQFDSNYPPLSASEWESLRIACSMPWHKEITTRFMPQEVGLLSDISLDKGCYVGQEVIAKAITYQKNPKFLQGVELSKDDWHKAHTHEAIGDSKNEIISLAPCFSESLINALTLVEKSSLAKN